MVPVVYFVGIVVFIVIAIITTKDDPEVKESAILMSFVWPILIVFLIFDIFNNEDESD